LFPSPVQHQISLRAIYPKVRTRALPGGHSAAAMSARSFAEHLGLDSFAGLPGQDYARAREALNRDFDLPGKRVCPHGRQQLHHVFVSDGNDAAKTRPTRSPGLLASPSALAPTAFRVQASARFSQGRILSGPSCKGPCRGGLSQARLPKSAASGEPAAAGEMGAKQGRVAERCSLHPGQGETRKPEVS
jgi:hypothetical protein